MKKKAIFLDRDGTLIVDKNYLFKLEEIEWIKDVGVTLKWLKEQGFLLIVLTNQSGVARGLFKENDVIKVNESLQVHLQKSQGITFDSFYYCPHLKNGEIYEYAVECECRKPKNGLFERAIAEWNIDVSRSIAIGDKERDLEPASNLGVKELYLLESLSEGNGLNNEKYIQLKNWSEFKRLLEMKDIE